MIKEILTGTLAAASALAANADELTLNGAGASFPAPVYQLWTYAYTQTGKAKVNYQSLGSGAGISQIKAGTVDFAGSDNPLSLQEQEEAGLVQFPMLTGGVVVIVNVPGVKSGELKLSRAVLADIFLGKITNWNDPAIAAINPGVKLPKSLPITVVRRSDSSGTTFIFTDYLSKISGEWKEKVGAGSAVKWPVGIGGQKNPGVCNNVAKIRGSIGYTEYTYAVETRLPMAILKNRAGKFVAPTPDTFKASAANAELLAIDPEAGTFTVRVITQDTEGYWVLNTPEDYDWYLTQCPENAKVRLGADIVIAQSYEVADEDLSQVAEFDGAGHTLTNMSLYRPGRKSISNAERISIQLMLSFAITSSP